MSPILKAEYIPGNAANPASTCRSNLVGVKVCEGHIYGPFEVLREERVFVATGEN
jgi:hypothetical protein